MLDLGFLNQMNKNNPLSIEKHQTILFLQFNVDPERENTFNTPRRPDSSVGDPVEVAQRSSAFALALGVVASSLEQLLATAVPQNAGAMGPSSQEDGRVRLAV